MNGKKIRYILPALKIKPVHVKKKKSFRKKKKGKHSPPASCEGSLHTNGVEQKREGEAVWPQGGAEDMAR